MFIADMRERSYTFDGLSGLSATLTDKEFPANALGKRELVFEVFLSVRDGGSANDLAAITPGLALFMEKRRSEARRSTSQKLGGRIARLVSAVKARGYEDELPRRAPSRSAAVRESTS
ncbi:MAG TPA: hypothetical protein VEO37_11430 [Thermoanaerobaculia bacterium]|nr:hypothetical protein [Thermoanaerobaculia bacterium]